MREAFARVPRAICAGAEATDRIHDELWLKFVPLTSLSGMMAVAHAKGIQLPPNMLTNMTLPSRAQLLVHYTLNDGTVGTAEASTTNIRDTNIPLS